MWADERIWSRRSPRAFAMLEFERIGALHNAVLIAAFHWSAPARCGACAASLPGHADRRYAIDDLARPWSRR
jgi:hypothetical protein